MSSSSCTTISRARRGRSSAAGPRPAARDVHERRRLRQHKARAARKAAPLGDRGLRLAGLEPTAVGRRAARAPSGRRCGAWRRSRARGCRARPRAICCRPVECLRAALWWWSVPTRQRPRSTRGSRRLRSRRRRRRPQSAVMLTTRMSESEISLAPSGRVTSPLDLSALFEALDRDDDVLRDRGGEHLEQKRGASRHVDRAGVRLALDVHGHVDLDALAGADDDEVDVLDDLTHRVALDVLDEGQLGACPRCRARARSWRDASDEHRLVARQREVHRVGAVAVQHGGDLVDGADLAGRALAEGLATLCSDLLGHVGPSVGPTGPVDRSAVERTPW